MSASTFAAIKGQTRVKQRMQTQAVLPSHSPCATEHGLQNIPSALLVPFQTPFCGSRLLLLLLEQAVILSILGYQVLINDDHGIGCTEGRNKVSQLSASVNEGISGGQWIRGVMAGSKQLVTLTSKSFHVVACRHSFCLLFSGTLESLDLLLRSFCLTCGSRCACFEFF